METLELYDGCTIQVKTSATTVEEFLAGVPTMTDRQGDRYFKYNGEWLPSWDLDFI